MLFDLRQQCPAVTFSSLTQVEIPYRSTITFPIFSMIVVKKLPQIL